MTTNHPAPVEPSTFALQWSENRPPCEECRYDHCTAETPFGGFLITWKSWKEYDSPTVDETPWGDSWQAFATVELAKAACQREFDARLALCGRNHPTPAKPGRVERLPDGKPCPTPPADRIAAAKLAAELRHFLAGYQQMRGLDPEYIYSIHRGDAMEAHLRVSRLIRAADLLQQQAAELAILRQQAAPVPVSERLPDTSDPSECRMPGGDCWWFDPNQDGAWYMDTYLSRYTHWLPATALPLPAGKVE
jgi:hypothetical protein